MIRPRAKLARAPRAAVPEAVVEEAAAEPVPVAPRERTTQWITAITEAAQEGRVPEELRAIHVATQIVAAAAQFFGFLNHNLASASKTNRWAGPPRAVRESAFIFPIGR